MPTRAERFREARDHMPISAVSPRGFVTVNRDDRGAVSVRLKGGTFSRLSERELAQEIQGGLSSALDEYARRTRELRSEILITDTVSSAVGYTRTVHTESDYDHRGLRRG